MKDRPLFKAPCNITKDNIMEIQQNYLYGINKKVKFPYTLICIRYKCGKIKWKIKNYKKIK